jgi:hypothetical protein
MDPWMADGAFVDLPAREAETLKDAISCGLVLLLALSIGQTPIAAVQLGDNDLGPPPPPAEVGARISFDELSHDWGTVLQGTKVLHTYRFRNTGTAVLRITNVKPG